MTIVPVAVVAIPNPIPCKKRRASNKNKLCAPKYITVAAKNSESEINNIFFLPKSSSHFPVIGRHKTDEIRKTVATKPISSGFPFRPSIT